MISRSSSQRLCPSEHKERCRTIARAAPIVSINSAGRLEAFALQPLALHLAGAADGFSRFARTALRRFFKMTAQLHLAKNPFALHLLLERLERLVDIVVANENLHLVANSFGGAPWIGATKIVLGRLPDEEGRRYNMLIAAIQPPERIWPS